MQTQCPECNTRFRLTDQQLDAAEGYVRCGVCQHVFNAREASLETSLETSPDASADTSEAITGHDAAQAGISSDSTEKPAARDAAGSAGEDNFDFFDESITESLPHVVPEKLRDDPVGQPNAMLLTAAWGLASLLLIITLMLQHVWFNRDQLVAVPEFAPVFEQLCSITDCQQISVRQPDEIELISRNVYSHPDAKQALKVDLSIRNNTRFAQPYPVMQIEFADVRGYVVAARQFQPEEYLFGSGEAPPVAPRLKPGVATELSLEIVDPGKHAVAYEFSFL